MEQSTPLLPIRPAVAAINNSNQQSSPLTLLRPPSWFASSSVAYRARLWELQEYPQERMWSPTELIAMSEYTCGDMNIICTFCDAKLWTGELNAGQKNQFGMCCKNGVVKLPRRMRPPQLLQALFSGKSKNGEVEERSRFFLEHIRKFNSSLSFASIEGAEKNHSLQGGPPSYTVNGSVYHSIGPILRANNQETPKFIQLYFFDTSEDIEARERLGHVGIMSNSKRAKSIITDLQSLIRTVNPYYRNFRQIVENPGYDAMPDFRLILKGPVNTRQHPGCYNLPVSDSADVAAVIINYEVDALSPSGTGDCSRARDIVVYSRHRKLQRIPCFNLHSDPLSYVIFFMHGEPGWDLTLTTTITAVSKKPRKLTAMLYYAYRLMVRDPPTVQHIDQDVLHHGRKLFQQYCVDMFTKIEEQRLNFILYNQAQLRSELYNGLNDALNHRDLLQQQGTSTSDATTHAYWEAHSVTFDVYW